MSSGEKRGKKKARVHPLSPGGDNQTYINAGFEMDSIDEEKKTNNYRALNKWKDGLNNVNSINVIANVKSTAKKWKHYTTGRRQSKKTGVDQENDRRRTGGLGLSDDFDESCIKDLVSQERHATKKQMVITHNRNLIQYFAKLGVEEADEVAIDLDYVEGLLDNGALINATDKYGQTILHEVGRAWHVDVARYIVEHGANLNQADNYGRTPLHVAAAVDYAEMVNFLIENGADKEALTKGEHQTAVHYAAKTDSCASLKALIKKGCEYDKCRDYKGRTPLHLAAELDRSEAARLLLELDDPPDAGVEDYSGQAAIVWMIVKMAPVAKLALDQFHTTDRTNRKQFYFLNHLEPRKPGEELVGCPQSAMQVIVTFHQFDLVCHGAVTKLIELKWKSFGRLGAWINMIMNLIFICLWTVIGTAVPFNKTRTYNLPDDIWRIVLWVLAILLSAWQIKDELKEFIGSKKSHSRWKNWRESEIDRDLEYAHPRWPEEATFLLCEKDELDKGTPQYFNDFWNIFDWIVYTMLLACITTHIVDVFVETTFLTRVHIRLMAVTVILVWLRLMKTARAFSLLGPFIVMLGHMVADCARFLFLYLEFFIPFASAFWMIFGGTDKKPETVLAGEDANTTVTVDGYGKIDELLFSMFRLTMVDDYDYGTMKRVDSLMAPLLVSMWLALSAILCLNLFIALLSDTFQRVYDNAKANAVMQKAITILNIEEGLSRKRRDKFRLYLEESCSPLVQFYDDDLTEDGNDDLKKVTFQIKEQLTELEAYLQDRIGKPKHLSKPTNESHGEQLDDLSELLRGEDNDEKQEKKSSTAAAHSVSVTKLEEEVDILREEIRTINDKQEEMHEKMNKDIGDIKGILQQIASNIGGGGGSAGVPPLFLEGDSSRGPRQDPDDEDGEGKHRRRSTRKLNKLKKQRHSQRYARIASPRQSGQHVLLDEGDYDDVQSSRPVSGGVTPKVEVRDYTEPLYDQPAEPEEGYENLRPPSSAPSDIRIRSTVLTVENMRGSDC